MTVNSAVSSSSVRTDTGAVRVVSVAQRRRRCAAATVDGLAWVVGILAAVVLRFEFEPTPRGWIATLVLALVAAALQVVVGNLLSFYRGRFSYGSFDEVRNLAVAVTGQAFILAVL